MSDWIVKHREHDGTLIGEFSPENLSFTLNNGDPHDINYEISWGQVGMTHDFVGPYRTDYELWYKDIPIIAGPHTSHYIRKSQQYSRITGKDWMHDWERRSFPFDARVDHVYDYVIGTPRTGFVYEIFGEDASVILKDLLDHIYGRPDSLNLTYPTVGIGIGVPVPAFTVSAGDQTKLMQYVKQLADSYPGFVYEILWTKEVRLYSPHKYDIGVSTDRTLANHVYTDASSSGLEDVEFGNLGPEGTHIYGTGAGFGGFAQAVSLGAPGNQSVYRRSDTEVQVGSNIVNFDVVEERTRRAFMYALQPRHEITLNVNPMEIGDNFWILQRPGEAVWVDVELYGHRIDSAQEISSMTVTVDQEGNISCNMKLLQIYDDSDATIGVYQA